MGELQIVTAIVLGAVFGMVVVGFLYWVIRDLWAWWSERLLYQREARYRKAGIVSLYPTMKDANPTPEIDLVTWRDYKRAVDEGFQGTFHDYCHQRRT